MRAGAAGQTLPKGFLEACAPACSADGTAEPCARLEQFACLGFIGVWLMPFWALEKRSGTLLIFGENEQIN